MIVSVLLLLLLTLLLGCRSISGQYVWPSNCCAYNLAGVSYGSEVHIVPFLSAPASDPNHPDMMADKGIVINATHEAANCVGDTFQWWDEVRPGRGWQYVYQPDGVTPVKGPIEVRNGYEIWTRATPEEIGKQLQVRIIKLQLTCTPTLNVSTEQNCIQFWLGGIMPGWKNLPTCLSTPEIPPLPSAKNAARTMPTTIHGYVLLVVFVLGCLMCSSIEFPW